MRILLFGGTGQVGWELRRELSPLANVVSPDRSQVDLCSPGMIQSAIRDVRPDLVVNAAAYTAVDQAEVEPELATAINAGAPQSMAEACAVLGSALIHYSTDYVFDGEKKTAYDEQDLTNPVNVYGRTKVSGERAITASGCAHLIFRTSWVYGTRGRNFLLTVLRLARTGTPLRIVGDQFGAPTWSRGIATATAAILARLSAGSGSIAKVVADRAGTYHMTAAGKTTWHVFADAILELHPEWRGQTRPPVELITTAEYPTRARRPRNSVLSNERLQRTFGVSLPDWRDHLALAVEE